MSIENQNIDPVDELRSLVLGENIASFTELEALERLAYSALEGAPVSRIFEVDYSVASGYLGLMLAEEDDLRPETAPAVVIAMHAGDTDDSYFTLSYDSTNSLLEPGFSPTRSQTENVFLAMNILQELLTSTEIDPLSDSEVAVVNRLAVFLKTIEGIKTDPIAVTSSSVHFTDVVRGIVRQKCSAIQHTREVNGRIGKGVEICITGAEYEQVEEADYVPPEERYPLLQIDLEDKNSGLITKYLSLATGERICDTDSVIDEVVQDSDEFYISDEEDETRIEADDIIAESMSGLDRDSIDRLVGAVRKLKLLIPYSNS